MPSRKICVVTSDVPFVSGGHLTIARSLVLQLREFGYQADLMLTPQNRFGRQLSAYLASWLTDVGLTGEGEKIDQVISFRFPSFAVRHPNHICWLNHRMREYYDLWETFYPTLRWKGRIKEHTRRFLIHRIDHYLLKKRVKRVYAQSKTIQSRLLRWGGIPSQVLYPPAPVRKYRTSAYQNFIFAVSRLDRLKRLDLLIDAFALAKNRGIRCLIAGEGREGDNLIRKIREKGLEGRVRLLGGVDDNTLIDYYARCRGVFFGPFNEDYGLVTLEAFSSHKPVLTCEDSGGPAELVQDGVSGFVVPPVPAMIADRIDLMAEDSALCQRLGEKGFELTLRITWEKVIQELTRE